MLQMDSTVATEPVLPRWTIPSFDRTPGRYPLGLEAVALDQLATVLASGLPVLSRHPRYWSIYTYIVKRFWDSKRTPQTNTALGAYLKPREIVFACAALLCPRHQAYPNGELPNVVGRDTFVPWLSTNPSADLPLDLTYLQNGLGGYGQIYRGAMAELGLIARAEANPQVRVDAPFGELGAAVADQFAASIAGTTYARRYADQATGAIPLGVIRELAEASCFCRLVDYPHECDLLTDVLLGRVQPPHYSHAMRFQTVRMVLDLAVGTSDTALDDEQFRLLLYFGAGTAGARWQPATSVETMRRLWTLVQLREYVARALNSLFTHFVRWGIQQGGLLYPLDPRRYAEVIQALPLSGWDALPAGSLQELSLQQLVSALDPVVERGGWPLTSAALVDAVHEQAFALRCDRGRVADAPVYALLLLLLVQRRLVWAEGHRQISGQERGLLDEGGVERFSTSEVCTWLADHVAAGTSAGTVLFELVRAMVIRQHLHVARGKLPNDTFRFHESAAGYQFVDHQDTGLASISIRFEAIGGALHGLGLIQAPFTEPGHGPTERGLAVLHA